MTTFDAATALVVVDVQNDFADRRGSLYVPGAEDALLVINRAIEEASEASAPIIYSRDWHPEQTPHFQAYGGVWPAHCVAESWGAEFHPTLRVTEGGHQVLKGVGDEDGYSAFSVRSHGSGETSPTQLEEILRRENVRRIVVVGLATDYCARETALDGLQRGFEVTVLQSAVRAVDLEPGDGERALDAIRAAGGVVA